MSVPRIAPVRQPDADQQELLRNVMSSDRGEPLHIFGTLAHHPSLMKRFNVMGGLFMTRSLLPPRLREIVILRVAYRTGCEYEWFQHVRIARDCGIGEEEIELLARDEAAGAGTWSPTERAGIAFTDDVIDNDEASDPTWADLERRMSEPQLLELTMLVGFYRMTAAFLKTMRVQPER